jgi:transcriptional regulator with XRE-family HTH domain
MSFLTSIKLNIAQKLESNQEYRKRFFRGQAKDEIALGIRSLRKKRGKRQIDLAKETGMRQASISRIEQAEYSSWNLNTLFRVADALDARLRVVFEPSEEIIEQYRNLEAESSEEENWSEFHNSSSPSSVAVQNYFNETPDKISIATIFPNIDSHA